MINRKYASPAAAVLAASMLALASSTSMAAIICDTTTVPLSVPQDSSGVYLNMITGDTTGGAGWDFNPYDRENPGIAFWFANDTNKGAVANDGTTYTVLASGATIGPASTFIRTNVAAAMVNFTAGQTGGYLGMMVYNEGTSTMNYGWIQMDTGTTGGFPATVNHFCFQNDGTAITAGTTPVSLQSYSVD